MTMLEIRPSAPVLSPLSPAVSGYPMGAEVSLAVMLTPCLRGKSAAPWRRGERYPRCSKSP